VYYLNRLEGIKRAKRILRIWDQCATDLYPFHNVHKYQDELTSKHPEMIWPKLMIKTRKLCSCQMCGHMRRMEGPTRQELIADEDMCQQLDDLEEVA